MYNSFYTIHFCYFETETFYFNAGFETVYLKKKIINFKSLISLTGRVTNYYAKTTILSFLHQQYAIKLNSTRHHVSIAHFLIRFFGIDSDPNTISVIVHRKMCSLSLLFRNWYRADLLLVVVMVTLAENVFVQSTAVHVRYRSQVAEWFVQIHYFRRFPSVFKLYTTPQRVYQMQNPQNHKVWFLILLTNNLELPRKGGGQHSSGIEIPFYVFCIS